MEVLLVSVGVVSCVVGLGLGYSAYRSRVRSRTGTAFGQARLMEEQRKKKTDHSLDDALLHEAKAEGAAPQSAKQPLISPKTATEP
ncbi:hypothetical protein DIPPA_70035 [Diplonema papillatum]|nr:hypothetical protein DIPPA_70035 [Diplonema papillatum]